MAMTVPLSDLSRRTTAITALVAHSDLILGRRDAADLYLSTVERHNHEVRGLVIATRALAALAAIRPDLAGDALTEALPWMAWLWYLIDDANRTLWLYHAGTGHPKATD